MKKVSVKVVADIRRLKNDNGTLLKLRITFKGERKYYGTSYSVILIDWEKINAMAVKEKLKVLENKMFT